MSLYLFNIENLSSKTRTDSLSYCPGPRSCQAVKVPYSARRCQMFRSVRCCQALRAKSPAGGLSKFHWGFEQVPLGVWTSSTGGLNKFHWGFNKSWSRVAGVWSNLTIDLLWYWGEINSTFRMIDLLETLPLIENFKWEWLYGYL